MKAIVQDRYGVDALHLADLPTPEPGPDDLLIRVHAAGVDAGVPHTVEGTPHLIRLLGFGLRAPKHRVPGMDLAGTVEAVGAAVTGFRPGDEVFGSDAGAFAEYARCRADRFAHKPARISFEQAAGIGNSGCAALQALRGRVRPGDAVLVIGAGGGVGTFAVQLAKAHGARVTGVCGTGKADLVRDLGAEVIDYTREEITGRYDLIVDIAGNRPLRHLRRHLAPKGKLVLVGGEEGGRLIGGIQRNLWAALLSPFTGQDLRGMLSRVTAADLATLREHIESGELTPVLGRAYPLADAAAAVAHVADGHARGKVVVVVRPDA